MKKTYIVTITETLCRQIEISAENADVAVDKVRNAYNDGDIVLDNEDYDSTNIDVAIFD